MANHFLFIALGGAIGATMRHGVGIAMLRASGAGFPWATVTVNVVGSFAMGILVVVIAGRGGVLVPFLITGLLGGFTTFSAFSADTLGLVERGQLGQAAGYVFLTVALSLGAIVAGFALGKGVLA